MRKAVLILAMLITTASLFSQDIIGKWNGVLNAGEISLRVDFNISKTDDGYSAIMDSPDQGAYGIPCDVTEFKEGDLRITVVNLGVEYKAKLNKEGVFDGTFTQMGQSFDMDLTQKEE